MASAVHAASPPYPPPTFSHTSTESSMNGIHLSQPQMNSFEAAQSIASTPTVTPPASRGHQHIMPLNLANYGTTNGNRFTHPNSRGIGEMNGHVPQQRYPPGHKPQIYTAVYSGVSVYEMEVNMVIVMRRRLDSWLNATQILKVAGIEKGKRTKVLEKEILAGEHEKVQGGYGKYQGTWINYARGVEFCRQYGVEEILRPLLEYDMGQDGVTTAGQGNIDTPTKEQAMAAQRKRNMLSGGIEQRPAAHSPNGTFFKNISKTAANAVNAISKARLDSPGPRPPSVNRRPISSRPQSQHMIGSQESAYQGSSQQSMQSVQSENTFTPNSQLDPALRSQNMPYYLEVNNHSQNGDVQEPPRKRARPSSQDPLPYNPNGSFDTSLQELTPIEPSQSTAYHQHGDSQLSVDLTMIGLTPLPQPTSNRDIEKQQILTSLFLDPLQTDFSKHPALLNLSGEDLDIPIDPTAHTALHWAATLARTSLLRALISKGASIFRLNGGGETALIRAALTTNNLDQGSFPELLELLGPTIEIRDGRGRTVLHHIAVSSAVKGRAAACRYYLESLLEFVVRQGSAASSQRNSFNNGADSFAPPVKSIGLARFMSEIVNATDMSGDTALNLAARIGNKSIIQQLLEVGANPAIPNRGGLKPIDFGVGDPETTEVQPSSQVSKAERDPIRKVSESSQEFLTSMSKLVNDASSSFKSELQSKQSLIDKTHAKLRETSSLLASERRRLDEMQRKDSERKLLRQKIANLRRANEELCKELALGTGSDSHFDLRTDIKIGEADAGLEVDASRLPETETGQPLKMTPAQREYLATLPPTEVLLARVAAYKKNNERLEAQAKSLQSRSSELEGQLRRVISICTGVPEEKIDEIAGGLVAAVESERGEEVEVGRVREFLRRVDGRGGD
ncbi:transcriptional regulator swi6 [Pseudocyphellaria aurata]|nr:transcriptional regulator swi6 [Pseudocyphellaria aurata]